MKMKKLLISTAILGGLMFTAGGVQAEASEWTANTPESIQIAQGATSYQFKLGDTVWAVATNQNLQTNFILNLNGLNSESARTLPIGYTLLLTNNTDGTADVTVQNQEGKTVASGTATNSDKVDETKPFGSSLTTNTNSNETSNGGSSSNDSSNNGEATLKPETPITPPVDPEQPVVPEIPVIPDKQMVDVKVSYFDFTNGILLGQETKSLEVGTTITFSAKAFTGYTLAGASSQTITVAQGSQVTFMYTQNAVNPPLSGYTVWYHGEGTTEFDIELGQHIFATKTEAQKWISDYADNLIINEGVSSSDYGTSTWDK